MKTEGLESLLFSKPAKQDYRTETVEFDQFAKFELNGTDREEILSVLEYHTLIPSL